MRTNYKYFYLVLGYSSDTQTGQRCQVIRTNKGEFPLEDYFLRGQKKDQDNTIEVLLNWKEITESQFEALRQANPEAFKDVK